VGPGERREEKSLTKSERSSVNGEGGVSSSIQNRREVRRFYGDVESETNASGAVRIHPSIPVRAGEQGNV